MNDVTVATYNRLEDTEPLKRRLEGAGIRSIIRDESNLQRFWFMTKAEAAIKVQVDRSQFETATNLLKEWDKTDHALQNAVRCPECGSSRIEYPQYTRKFITPILVEVFVSMGFFPKEFYCQDCQYTWPKEEKPEPETDLLGWPVAEGTPRDQPVDSAAKSAKKSD